jgi:hypothetical protein
MTADVVGRSGSSCVGYIVEEVTSYSRPPSNPCYACPTLIPRGPRITDHNVHQSIGQPPAIQKCKGIHGRVPFATWECAEKDSDKQRYVSKWTNTYFHGTKSVQVSAKSLTGNSSDLFFSSHKQLEIVRHARRHQHSFAFATSNPHNRVHLVLIQNANPPYPVTTTILLYTEARRRTELPSLRKAMPSSQLHHDRFHTLAWARSPC